MAQMQLLLRAVSNGRSWDALQEDFALIPDDQLWPRSRNAEIGGTPDGYYLIVANIGSNSGQGLDFINGYAFLERYYSYYDTKDSKMGFATTKYTTAVVNSQA